MYEEFEFWWKEEKPKWRFGNPMTTDEEDFALKEAFKTMAKRAFEAGRIVSTRILPIPAIGAGRSVRLEGG